MDGVEDTFTIVYWGHTVGFDSKSILSLSDRHKLALAKQLAFDIQVLYQIQEVVPILVASEGSGTPTKLIEARMATLSLLAPDKVDELLSEALDLLAKLSGDGAGVQAMLLASRMI